MDVTTPRSRGSAAADPEALIQAARALRARTLAALLRRALRAATRRRPAPRTAVPTPAG